LTLTLPARLRKEKGRRRRRGRRRRGRMGGGWAQRGLCWGGSCRGWVGGGSEEGGKKEKSAEVEPEDWEEAVERGVSGPKGVAKGTPALEEGDRKYTRDFLLTFKAHPHYSVLPPDFPLSLQT